MKKAVYMILALALLVSVAGCSGGNRSGDGLTEYQIAGFESERELLTMSFRNNFGQADITNDAKYVTQGSAAAKLHIIGDYQYQKGFYSDTWFHIIPGNEFLLKTSFSDVVAMKVDIYNESGRPVNFRMGLNNTQNNEMLFDIIQLEEGMNHLLVPFDREYLSVKLDLETVRTIDFYFEGRNDDQPPYELAIDNLVAVTTERESAEPEFDFTANKIFEFDTDADAAAVNYMGASTGIFTRPSFTVNRDLRFVLNGKTSLKMEFYPNREGTAVDATGFRTEFDVTRQIPFTQYDPESTYITFDVCNTSDRLLSLSFRLFNERNLSFDHYVNLEPNSWSEPSRCRVLLQDVIDEIFAVDIMSIVMIFDGMPKDGCEIYLDNIRFETEG